MTSYCARQPRFSLPLERPTHGFLITSRQQSSSTFYPTATIPFKKPTCNPMAMIETCLIENIHEPANPLWMSNFSVCLRLSLRLRCQCLPVKLHNRFHKPHGDTSPGRNGPIQTTIVSLCSESSEERIIRRVACHNRLKTPTAQLSRPVWQVDMD